jgi:hypothetical protein
LNFEEGKDLILAGTIQFATAIQSAKRQLAVTYPSLSIPQSRPLSPGRHPSLPYNTPEFESTDCTTTGDSFPRYQMKCFAFQI